MGKGRTRHDLAPAQPRQPLVTQLAVRRPADCSDNAVMLRPRKKRRAAPTAHSRHDLSKFMNVKPAKAQFRRPGDAQQASFGQDRKSVKWNERQTVNVLGCGEQFFVGDSLRNCGGRLDLSCWHDGQSHDLDACTTSRPAMIGRCST
jgi:hypothetical protein